MNLLASLPGLPGLPGLPLPFEHEDTTVLIGSYLSHDAGRHDFDAALACGASLHGAILVSKSLTGTVSAEQSDHMVREGAQALGVLGLFTGLFMPALIPVTIGAGAIVGGILGQTLHLVTESRGKDQAADMIPLGCAVLLVAFPNSSTDVVQPAVSRALSKTLGHGHGYHVEALKAALADAQQHMSPGSI